MWLVLVTDRLRPGSVGLDHEGLEPQDTPALLALHLDVEDPLQQLRP